MKNISEDFSTVFSKNQPVIILHAHPDDESFLSAGIIRHLLESGYTCKLVYLAAALVKNETRTVVRQREAQKAANILGLEPPIFLPFCEPKYTADDAKPLCTQDPVLVANVIIDVVNRMDLGSNPTFLSYDKNGGYGNKDHIILHKAGRLLRELYQHTVVETTINRTKMSSWIVDAQSRLQDNQIPQLKYWIPEYGLSEDEIDYYLALSDDDIALKRRSLIAHTSQLKEDEFPLTLPFEDFNTVFGTKYLSLVK